MLSSNPLSCQLQTICWTDAPAVATLHVMGNHIIVGGLVLLAAGCGPALVSSPRAGTDLSQRAAPVPSSIAQDDYDDYRERFDVLDVGTRGREDLRDKLMHHLVIKTHKLLDREQESEAIKSFRAALTLFDAVEVFAGKLRSPDLAKVAARILTTFSPRGEEAHVLLALCVQASLGRDRASHLKQYREIINWLKETDELVHGSSRMWIRLIHAMERVAKVWPSSFVLDELRKLYIEQKIAITQNIRISPYRHLGGAVSAMYRTGYKVARMYLLVDRPQEALKRLEEIITESNNQEEQLHLLLKRGASSSADVESVIRLAEYFEERDREVALRICAAAKKHFSQDASIFWCVGRMAADLKRTYMAVINLERAVQLSPDKHVYAEKLAQQYQHRLFQMIGDEKLLSAQKELKKIEGFYKRTAQRNKKPLEPPLSRVYYAIGHGLFNAGMVDLAQKMFKKSVVSQPSPEALIQLASISLKRGDARTTQKILKQAESLPMRTPHARAYWQGRIEGIRGQALELGGNTKKSLAAHRQAVTAWRQLQAMGLVLQDQAEAYIYEARSLYALGDRARAMDVLDRAIDVQPDRKETYADVIALLATFGHLPEALDAFHRALGRREVSEYLKTYCSFWIIGMARRARIQPDPLAIAHIQRIISEAWYTQLAQLMLGKTTYERLLSKATTPGNLAELYFYQADHLVAQGKLEEARALWKKVIQTEMMAFYEYDMAAYNLRFGPSKVLTQPLDRKRMSTR